MVYILTDSNRKQWVFGICKDLSELSRRFTRPDQAMGLLSPVNRLVYLEECDRHEGASDRLDSIRSFTACQRDRLIRQRNRNWNNLLSVAGQSDVSRQLSYAV